MQGFFEERKKKCKLFLTYLSNAKMAALKNLFLLHHETKQMYVNNKLNIWVSILGVTPLE